MTNKKLTHVGVIRGIDNRTPDDWMQRRKFRETKLYWIDQYGHKYSKKWGGSGVGDWPMYRLIVDSLKEV